MRGFDFEAIGALDESGNVIGGNRLLEFSTEFDYRVGANWGVAAFIDAASVTRSEFSTDFERGAGVGFRWYSPIGPVRFDIARPLDRADRSVRIHISLGPDL